MSTRRKRDTFSRRGERVPARARESRYTAQSIGRAIGVQAIRDMAIGKVAPYTNYDLERKFFDTSVTALVIGATWAGGELDDATALSLSSPGQGDGESQRDGRTYTIRSIHLRGIVTQPVVESNGTPLADIYVRLCLVWDTQSNGAQLNAEDVMLTVASAENYRSFRNLQFSKRFIVLKDKTMKIAVAQANTNEGAANLFANGAVKTFFKMNKTWRGEGIKVRTTATGATIAATSDNSLHLIGVSESGTTIIDFTSRCRFTG